MKGGGGGGGEGRGAVRKGKVPALTSSSETFPSIQGITTKSCDVFENHLLPDSN